MTEHDVAIVGAGIVGLATARELLRRRPERRVVVLERHSDLAREQTGANSGVVHAGVYYEPGSLKAKLCVEGARELYEFCDERGIRAERVGKVIVATEASELAGLDELERRGRANGVPGLRRIAPDELRELEPHARGVAALHSPNTGIVDFGAVAHAFAADVEAAGGVVVRGVELTRIGRGSSASGVRLVHSGGRSVRLVHSAGQMAVDRAIF